jgi:alpha-L-glutamate ligase-like protein
MFLLSTKRRLQKRGIVGINKRNAYYILRFNPRHLFKLVDDKAVTKQLAMQAGISVPKLYGAIEIEAQIKQIPEIIGDKQDFVIKPANGSGGYGIMVINGRYKDYFRKSSGALIKQADIDVHVSNILSGMHSLGGYPDQALIEHRVEPHDFFQNITYQGVPDIRVIVFLGYPIMAMARLPTRLSDGKANLHQSAIGAGIDILTGITTNGVRNNDFIDFHPDTLQPIIDLRVPEWDKVLDLAASCYELTQLGYLGVDIVLDKTHGPLMLELNARPGLNIQIANKLGLQPRLTLIEAEKNVTRTAQERIAFIKEHY